MLRLLKFILLLIIVIGASVGATMWFTSRDGTPSVPAAASATEQPAPAAPVVVPAPIFAELDPFTVTLYGETRNRILYTAITLRLGDEASRKQITDYMPEVRDRILKVLSAQQLPLIQKPEGRQALVDALKAALTHPFAAQLPSPQIADVLFTAFVVQ
ncbi:flagellar basal body-associated FliL family protein [Castellaniella defragrans]|jgi:flagellar FliL protein|uniref:Flagellar protein FliL n=2 Tax=Castellaniella defragrans TaxID=75697 RepID=W8WYZ8_CASD6|nr:flagellar basal body-associated FliL family protein [Castellaniella defragrans]KAB0600426.1 flagellar basal body-associated protein FliL [Castellaniella defragrans]MBB6082386.1 flagellar FliL protein [Castellaniella defragrans]CDM24809.1 flagellar basal body-associated protein FliL [Castellaniella defragrans 65Phen]